MRRHGLLKSGSKVKGQLCDEEGQGWEVDVLGGVFMHVNLT